MRAHVSAVRLAAAGSVLPQTLSAMASPLETAWKRGRGRGRDRLWGPRGNKTQMSPDEFLEEYLRMAGQGETKLVRTLLPGRVK